jgi:hypothetical protein
MIVERDVSPNGVAPADATIAGNRDAAHRLRSVVLDETAALLAYHRLAYQITDPTAGVVLALLARDAEQDRTMVQRMLAGALDVFNWNSSSARHGQQAAIDGQDAINQIEALARTALSRAQRLRHLARSERDVEHAPRAMLLDAMAFDSEKHARLLADLGGYLRGDVYGPLRSLDTR